MADRVTAQKLSQAPLVRSPDSWYLGHVERNHPPSMSTQTFSVRFDSDALDSPEFIGPFYTEDDAQEYADDRNSSLALSGIPSSVACYSVV